VFANSTGLPTLRDLVGHIAYDEAWVPHLLTGQTMDEVGSRNYGGDLLGEDPKGSYAELAAAARDSGRQANDLDRVVHCSFGDCSTEEYLRQLIVARSIGSDSIATAVGADTPLTAELAQAVWDGLTPRVELWRQVGVLYPEVPVPGSAPIRDRLLGLVGQHP